MNFLTAVVLFFSTAYVTKNELIFENLQPSGEFDQNFIAACESDKVAASRAVAQNQQLKEQLEELEIAVIQVVSFKFYIFMT